MANEWLLWQLCDSAFPSGGFAHSGGLEAVFQSRFLAGAGGFGEFLRAAMAQTARAAGPFTAAACREPGEFERLNALCDAALANRVANRASRAQGQAFLTAVARGIGAPQVLRFATLVRERRCVPHLAPVLGAAGAALGLGPERCSGLLMFLSLRGYVSAAVRLGIVGPLEGQSVQHEVAQAADGWVSLACRLNVDEAAQTAPLLDLIQGSHDRLYSRLFQS